MLLPHSGFGKEKLDLRIFNPKRLLSKNFKAKIRKYILTPIDQFSYRLPDIISTEYNFRFRRHEIQKELEEVRKLPRNLHIEGTNTCNAKCTFCAYSQMERTKETMPMEHFQRIVDEYIAMGGKYVSLTPIVGDPFVDRHLLERLNYLDQCPQIQGFDFFTNGILMKPQVSEKLMQYGSKLHVHLSWGGFDRETYKSTMGVDHFDLVRKNLEAFLELKRSTQSPIKFKLELRCPPSNWNGPFWDVCQAYQQEGLLEIRFVGKFDSWAGKVKDEALQKVGLEPVVPPYKRGACELLYQKPVILANGKVNACACRDVEAELIIGDLHESTLAEIWNSPAIDALIQRHDQGDFPEVCKRCTWYNSVYNLNNRSARINQEAIAANQS